MNREIPEQDEATCQHWIVTRWQFEDDGSPAPMWTCNDCRRKFEPVSVRRMVNKVLLIEGQS